MAKNNIQMDIPQEEQVLEQGAAQELKEEEVRSKIIAELGFDEVDDAERIDKLVAKEMENHKKLSIAIRQKIDWRTKATTAPTDPPKPSQEAPKPATEDIGKVVAQELEKRDLDSLEYSDDLKKEIQRVAQVQNISIKQAARDPYIVFKIGEWEKAQKADEAAISRTNRSSGKKQYSLDAPPEVDMSSAEGRKEYDDWIAWAKKNGG
jgi:hypothetical protein